MDFIENPLFRLWPKSSPTRILTFTIFFTNGPASGALATAAFKSFIRLRKIENGKKFKKTSAISDFETIHPNKTNSEPRNRFFEILWIFEKNELGRAGRRRPELGRAGRSRAEDQSGGFSRDFLGK